jgi:serine/threonine protein kinase
LFYTTFKDHPHLVYTFGFVENDRGSTMILQERAPHGNLQSLLETGQFQPSAKVLVEIFSQIIDTMLDVIGQRLVHGDLRCENILVFEMYPTDPKRNLVKLTSFSLAHPNNSSYHDDRRLFLPMRYCAPEIVRSVGRSNYSEYSDVYAMGVLMWQAFSKGKLPYGSSKTDSES